ncbi:MAG: ABC transporter permease [Bacteroidales bacterium]
MNKLININQLQHLITAMFKELIREPGVLFWGIIFPILMSVGLGLAFTKKQNVIRKVAIIQGVADNELISGDTLNLSLLKQFGDLKKIIANGKTIFQLSLNDENLGNTLINFEEKTWKEAMIELKRGTLNLVIVNNNQKPEYHFDPANSDAQLTYLKLSGVYGSSNNPIIRKTLIQPLTITGTRYIDFLVPGLIAMGVMMSCMWGLSYGIIDKRSKKLLRRMVATPMKKSHFLTSLVSVRLGMNIIEALLLIVFVYFAFGITIQGSIPALITLFVAGNIGFAGIAIFISSHTSNTEIGNGFINAVVMPMMVLSGVFFSYYNFPDWSIPVIQKLPLTMLADGIRSIFIEGAGFSETLFPISVLLFLGFSFAGIGLKIFKWH